MTSNKSLTVNECKESFKTRHGYIKFCTPRIATLLQFLQYHYHHFHYLILTPSSNLLTTEGTYILVSSTNINCVCRICILSYLFLYCVHLLGIYNWIALLVLVTTAHKVSRQFSWFETRSKLQVWCVYAAMIYCSKNRLIQPINQCCRIS